jgi:hypothetical protein
MKEDAKLFCGAAKIDITPPIGSVMNGEFLPRYAEIINDPIYAKALIFEDAAVTVAIILVDTCIVPADLTEIIKQGIYKSSGIPPGNIVVAATHIHSSGSLTDIFLTPSDKNYQDLVSNAIVDVVGMAKKNMQPAKIAFGKADLTEHVACRRYKMKDGFKAFDPFGKGDDKVVTNPFGVESEIEARSGSVDPELSFIAIQSESGKWLGVLANYSLHYVGDFASNIVSSDYFGMFERKLAEKLAVTEDFIGILSNGTSGNVNIWDFLQPNRYPDGPFAKSDKIAEDLAEAVVQQTSDFGWNDNPRIEMLSDTLTWRVRKPSADELRKAHHIYDRTDYNDLSTDNEDNIEKIYAREQILLSEEPDYYDIQLSAICIGGIYIGTVSGEIFAETGLWLKQQMAPKSYFTICLANESFGYAPPDHESDKGGYETWRCRSSKLERGADQAIREKLLSMLLQLG